jgi:hypothetical protein
MDGGMMKHLIILAAFLFSLSASANLGIGILGSILSSPANGTVVATTGSLTSGCKSGSGNYIINALVSASTGATFDMQSVSSGTVVSHTYLMASSGSSFFLNPNISFAIPDGITVQIVTVSIGLLSNVQANLYYSLDSCN